MKKTCAFCGKPLKEYWGIVTDKEIARLGEPLKRKSRFRDDIPGHVNWEMGFWGNHGYLGNGSFCTKDCGYRYALYTVRREPLTPPPAPE